MKEYAKSFYKSKQWRQCRESYFNSQHGICERCGNQGKIVHHKKTITPENINDTYITLSWDNLELLCQDCHNKVDHYNDNPVTREGLMFDQKGDLVRRRPHA